MTKQHVAKVLTWGDSRSRAKLEQLILYLANKCQDDENFGATKLNKVLFYSDFLAFAHLGKSITNAQYMRLPQGPVPKHLLAARKRLEDQGKLVLKKELRFGVGRYEQHRHIPLEQAELSRFSPDEIALVDQVVDALRRANARQVSDFSHGRIWKIAGEDKALIPYEAVFISDHSPSQEDILRTQELAEKHGWDEAA